MSDCLSSIYYQGIQINTDSCANTISYQTNDNNFTFESLMDLSQICFKTYKHRLENISPKISKVGEDEFQIINKCLISLILQYNPFKFSFSITSDPSLHFFIRFPNNVSLFVETFLDIEDGHDTYFQVFRNNKTIFQLNSNFDNGLEEIENILTDNIHESEVYKELLKTTNSCLINL